PAAMAAASATKNKKIGIIGTSSTVASGKYEQAISKIDKSIFVKSIACPMFVPLAENNMADSEAAYLIAKDYLSGFDKTEIDTLILGCTHYPLLAKTVKRVLGNGVMLIDSGKATADFVAQYLEQNSLLAEKKKSEQYKFFVSDSVDGFLNVANIFLNKNIEKMIEKIDIERY
ncbi:MAG: aspartate/glutamate racemase family protein, partial [Clostridia bacterium]|nr:aspartate/glutamate racemase family protein [Clostridia bacterium]